MSLKEKIIKITRQNVGEGNYPYQKENCADQILQAIKEEIPKRVKNKDIKKFGCYNTEGNIRMQDGFNQAVKLMEKKLGIEE